MVFVAAIVGDSITQFDPNRADLANAFLPPGAEHSSVPTALGATSFTRLLAGARITLLAAALASVVAIAIALPPGFSPAITRKVRLDRELVHQRHDGTAGLVVLLAVGAALGKSVWITMTALGVLISRAVPTDAEHGARGTQ